MSAKRNSAFPKQTQKDIRARYQWHLLPPFDKWFDRSHWWEEPGVKREPAAALFELARRHPNVGKTLLAWVKSTTPEPPLPPAGFKVGRFNGLGLTYKSTNDTGEPLYWTCRYALKSWPKLEWTDRKLWENSIRGLKGLYLCGEMDLCCSVDELAMWKIRFRRDTLPTRNVWDSAFATSAIEAHKQGYLLISIAPGLTPAKVGKLVAKLYREKGCASNNIPKRARWDDWLLLISAFEKVAASQPKVDTKQAFIRYRRALTDIPFL
jgi:hypothetical protein